MLRFASRTWFTVQSPAACLAGAACLVSLAGCSTRVTNEARLRAMAVEPELPAVTTSADPWRSSTTGVPEVIPPPRPFRVSDLHAFTDLAARPATLAATLPAVSLEPSGAAEGFVRPVAATEPSREPAALPAAERATVSGAGPLVGEIRTMLADYMRAFNRHDVATVAAHWTLHGENLNLDTGELTAGREAVRDVFATLFEADAGVSLDIDLTSIRPVRADVALVDGLARVGSAEGPAVTSRFSAVVVRDDGQWRLDSIREAAAQAAVAPARPLDELAWLVGFWEDDGDGLTAGTRCDWTPGKGFLLRTHQIAPDPVPAQLPHAGDENIPGLLPTGSAADGELTELIGWDPDRQAIRSWIFTADGRFAEGTWHRENGGWTVLVEGRGADAGREAHCRLLPHGPEGLLMQCSGDDLDGLVPPACGFTRTAR